MNKQQHQWTDDEVQRLRLAARDYGKNWHKMRKHCFKHLREDCIRNKFYKLGLHVYGAADDVFSSLADNNSSQSQLWEITKALGQQQLYIDNL